MKTQRASCLRSRLTAASRYDQERPTINHLPKVIEAKQSQRKLSGAHRRLQVSEDLVIAYVSPGL
ncbi:hypothetical protein AAY473_016022 [Plecturocebus cupreus]